MTQADDLEQLAARLRVLEGRVGAYERDRLAQRIPDPTEARLGFMESPSGVAGAGPYEEHALIAADIITAREITAGSITAEKLATASVLVAALGHADGNLLDNWSFEDGPAGVAGVPYGWYGEAASANGGMTIVAGAGSIGHGDRVLRNVNIGDDSWVWSEYIPVRAGAMYQLSAYLQRVSGTDEVRAAIYSYDKAKATQTARLTLSHTTTTMTRYEGTYTTPTDGSVAYLRVRLWHTSATATHDARWDAVTLREAAQGVKNTPGEVLIDSSGIAVTNGKITVTNAGATVIIDGTSNMFKISATGTLSRTQAVDTNGIVTVDLTGLGTRGTSPAHISYVAFGNTTAAFQHVGWAAGVIQGYVAVTSGGVVGESAAIALAHAVMTSHLSAGSTIIMRLALWNYDSASVTAYGRYYVLAEAAL